MTAQEHSQPFPVPVAEYVGRFYLTRPDGQPNCALGHLHAALPEFNRCNVEIASRWDLTYRRLASIHLRVPPRPVHRTNDSIECAETRRLLYHATWCLLGFTDGMPEDALALAEQVKADNPGVFNKEI